MSVGPTLETERLILRPPTAADFDRWAGFAADPDAARFLGGAQPRSVAWRAMMAMAGSWAVYGFAMFSVIEKASGRWIGRLGPWRPDGWPGSEIAWGLAQDAWGKGYATEGAIAAMDWAFDNLGWVEVIHTIEPENWASQAVAKRLGSRLLGPGRLPAPFEGLPVEIWGQSRDAWRSRPR